MIDQDTIRVDGCELRKAFIEKPFSGGDHNVYIYYSSEVRRAIAELPSRCRSSIPGISLAR